MKCFRAIFPEILKCEIQPFELPAIKANEVLVRVESSLISPGTETNIFTGRHSNLQRPNPGWPRFPFEPGYAAAGRVLQIGAEVKEIQVGNRVALPCTHATHAISEPSKVTLIPEALSTEHATFAELGAIALNGVRIANIGLGDSVVVAGQGLIGLLATRMLKLSGAMPLLSVDLCESRRAIGLAYGADQVLDPIAGNSFEAIKNATGGRRADVVIEATGVPRVVTECLTWARNHGRVVLLGSPHGNVEMSFYPDLHSRNLHLLGAHVGASYHPSIGEAPWTIERNRKTFLDFAAKGAIQIDPLITRRVVPDEMKSAYQSFAETPNDQLGVVVNWTQIGDDLA